MWAHWSSLYKNILDQHAPIKKKWLHCDQLLWISPEIQQEIFLQNRMFKHHRRDPSTDTCKCYKRQRNKVTSFKRKGVKEICTYATSASKNPAEFWRKMKPLLPSSRSNTQNSITVVENGCVTSKPIEVAEIFNDHFWNIVQAGNSLNPQDFTTHVQAKCLTLSRQRHTGHLQLRACQFQLCEYNTTQPRF